VVQAGDLHLQDNRYLHNTLTSEVFERSADVAGSGIVDVGVEDLTDLEHLEALDEVRQWEDRVVSQHMIVLQEDARLLTEESELLSQVQQGATYDIDWYVSEVDKVVRRKMDVYAGFLEDLEVFKAQLRREETLNRNCQRNRTPVAAAGASGSASAGLGDWEPGGPHASPRAQLRDSVALEATPQRLPRTPRPPPAAGSGAAESRGTPESVQRVEEELSAHALALEHANAKLREEAERAKRRVTALEEQARAAVAAKDAHIASLEERIEASSQMMLESTGQDKVWPAGNLAAVQRVWRCPSLPF